MFTSEFSTWPKDQDKILNILRTKRAFKMKPKVFFIIFKGLSLKQLKQTFLGRAFDFNTRIYNPSSIPQITRFLLVDAITSSKTNPCSASKKQKRKNSKVRKIKTMSVIIYLTFLSKTTKQNSLLLLQFKVWKKVNFAINFSDIYFVVRGWLIQLKRTK